MIENNLPAENTVVSQNQVAVGVSGKGSTDLSIRTQEGDVVNFSLDIAESIQQSASETQFEDGATVQEFSSAARAASQYSFSVEGDLNEEELSAINELAERVAPIAQSFFEDGEIDLASAVDDLSGSLGVIEEVELRLERSVEQTFATRSFAVVEQTGNAVPSSEADTVNQETGGLDPQPSIQDIRSLVSSVVESVFREQASAFTENVSIPQSLEDLLNALKDKLGEFAANLFGQNNDNQNVEANPEQSASDKAVEA